MPAACRCKLAVIRGRWVSKGRSCVDILYIVNRVESAHRSIHSRKTLSEYIHLILILDLLAQAAFPHPPGCLDRGRIPKTADSSGLRRQLTRSRQGSGVRNWFWNAWGCLIRPWQWPHSVCPTLGKTGHVWTTSFPCFIPRTGEIDRRRGRKRGQFCREKRRRRDDGRYPKPSRGLSAVNNGCCHGHGVARDACRCAFPACSRYAGAAALQHPRPPATRVFGTGRCGVMSWTKSLNFAIRRVLMATGVAVPLANQRGSASAALVNARSKARRCIFRS